MPKDGGIGAATTRREDVRFLTGEGQYSDDHQTTRQASAVFARSNVANGVIKSIDTSAAAAMPGVLQSLQAKILSKSAATRLVG